MDYYQILGVTRDSEREVVDAAYRALIKKYHPGLWRGERAEAELRSRKINEAYKVLKDERRRRDYDAGRSATSPAAARSERTEEKAAKRSNFDFQLPERPTGTAKPSPANVHPPIGDLRIGELTAIEAGKRCVAIVSHKMIAVFLVAGAFNIFINRNDIDALEGSLAGLACLLAIVCVCVFAFGFVTSVTGTTASIETHASVTESLKQQSADFSKKEDVQEHSFAWLILGLLFWFWQSGFSITAMPGTATNYLRAVFLGLSKLLGAD